MVVSAYEIKIPHILFINPHNKTIKCKPFKGFQMFCNQLPSKWSKRGNFEIKIHKHQTKNCRHFFGEFKCSSSNATRRNANGPKKETFPQNKKQKFVCLKQFNNQEAQISILVSKNPTQIHQTKKKNKSENKTKPITLL